MTEAAADFVRIEGVSKTFDGVAAVDNVSLQIRRGEVFALLGGSGCGKSTLLRLLAGFEQPSAGAIYVDGQRLNDVPPHRRPVNMMFQSYALFPHLSVFDNIAFGLRQERMARGDVNERVQQVLKLVHMEQFARRKPHQLSGGQQQRTALARSLAKRPKLLLLDEPMGALDKKLRTRMQLEIVNILESVGVTCIMVTHDQEEAMTMAERIAVMESGCILQVGAPHAVYEYPNCRSVAEFIGDVNLFEGEVIDEAVDYMVVRAEGLEEPLHIGHGAEAAIGMPVTIALRPEKIAVSAEPPARERNVLRGKIVDIAYFGSHSDYHVKLPSGRVVVAEVSNLAREGASPFTWEDTVYLHWQSSSALVLTQ